MKSLTHTHFSTNILTFDLIPLNLILEARQETRKATRNGNEKETLKEEQQRQLYCEAKDTAEQQKAILYGKSFVVTILGTSIK